MLPGWGVAIGGRAPKCEVIVWACQPGDWPRPDVGDDGRLGVDLLVRPTCPAAAGSSARIVERKADIQSEKMSQGLSFCGTQEWYTDNEPATRRAKFFFDGSVVVGGESLPLRQQAIDITGEISGFDIVP